MPVMMCGVLATSRERYVLAVVAGVREARLRDARHTAASVA